MTSPPSAEEASPRTTRPRDTWLANLLLRSGKFFFRRRNSFFPIAFVIIAGVSRPRALLGSERADAVMDGVGFGIALAGQLLRAVVVGLVYIRRGGKHQRFYADDLVQEGMFAHSRNPLYVGNALILLGLFVILNSPAGYLIGIPFFGWAYFSIVFGEEKYLRERFGAEYEDYCRRVNRFLPSLRGLGHTLRAWPFDVKRVVRKEYGTTFTWLTSALAVVAWERIARGGSAAARVVLPAVLLGFAVVLLSYLVVRWLKKSGRLESPER